MSDLHLDENLHIGTPKKIQQKKHLRLSCLIIGLIGSNQTYEEDNITMLGSDRQRIPGLLKRSSYPIHFICPSRSPSSFDGSETPSQSNRPR